MGSIRSPAGWGMRERERPAVGFDSTADWVEHDYGASFSSFIAHFLFSLSLSSKNIGEGLGRGYESYDLRDSLTYVPTHSMTREVF